MNSKLSLLCCKLGWGGRELCCARPTSTITHKSKARYNYPFSAGFSFHFWHSLRDTFSYNILCHVSNINFLLFLRVPFAHLSFAISLSLSFSLYFMFIFLSVHFLNFSPDPNWTSAEMTEEFAMKIIGTRVVKKFVMTHEPSSAAKRSLES